MKTVNIRILKNIIIFISLNCIVRRSIIVYGITPSAIDIQENNETNYTLNENETSITYGNINATRGDKNYTELIRLSNLLDIFNVGIIGEKWYSIRSHLNENCSADMSNYLNGLENGRMWAIKMDDASGHYTTGFFYGNNYWTGSLALCSSICREDNKTDLKSTTGFNAMTHNSENPPFQPAFFVVKILLNVTKILYTPRVIHIGICLPTLCTNNDLSNMVHLSQDLDSNKDVAIMNIRSPTQKSYKYWEDRTFITLIVVTIIVATLIILGTLFEIYLTYKIKRKRHMAAKLNKEIMLDASQSINCTTYDLSRTAPNSKTDLTLGVVIPRGVNNNNNSEENLAANTLESEEGKISVLSELLLSFSLITNIKVICDKSVGSDTIPSIHGLRAISMAWVILGHTCIVVFKYSDNMELRKVVEKQFLFQTITNGAFSVDTFFFISGFLVSYIYCRTNANGKLEKLSKGLNEITAGTFHFLGLVSYRFVRLTAPYIYVLGIVEVTMKYFENYSVFDPPTMDHINCQKYWWRNILYINTFYPVEEMCMLWSWYLANDTQFYIVGAIILIVGVRHFKIAYSILIALLLSSWATTAYVSFSNNHIPSSDDPLALFDKIYDKPWTRLGPYLIGMSVGWLLFKTGCKIRMSKLAVVTGWATSTAAMVSLIYGLYDTRLSVLTAAAYSSLSHTIWAISIAWIVIACSTGYGGYVNTLLSAPFIYPFSRVTYCAYLVHPLVIRVLALNSDAPLHLGTDSMVIIFFGQVVSSYILSFIVSISFEAPVVTMLKILTPNRKKRII